MNLELFRLPTSPSTPVQPIPQKRKEGKFLRGPILIDWLQSAGHLPGKALHVGNVLWFLSGVQRSSLVVFSYSLAEKFGVKRHAAYRGLDALEQAGLIKVERGKGKSPRVQLLEDPDGITDAESERLG